MSSNETPELQARIVEALCDGPMKAKDLWCVVSDGADSIWAHYRVAVQLQPMIRAGILATDCDSPFKDDDRVVTAGETISLAGVR